VKGTVEGLKGSSIPGEEDRPSPAGTAAEADKITGKATAGAQAQETPSEDRQKAGSTTFDAEGSTSGSQGQEQSGAAGDSQTAGAAGASASNLMSRFRNMAEVVRREVCSLLCIHSSCVAFKNRLGEASTQSHSCAKASPIYALIA